MKDNTNTLLDFEIVDLSELTGGNNTGGGRTYDVPPEGGCGWFLGGCFGNDRGGCGAFLGVC